MGERRASGDNMKVYVVTEGDYSDYHIEAIFTEKEQAEKYIALHTSRCYYDWNIEEWEVDATHIDGEVKMLYRYSADFRRDNERYRWAYKTDVEGGITGKAVADEIKREQTDDFIHDFHRGIIGYSVFLDEPDLDKALKIFDDYLAELNAKEQGIM